MSPGGHLVTTAIACGAAAALTRGLPAVDSALVVAAVATGGFLIDVDHAIDYVVFERQRDLRPSAFLRYYLEFRPRLLVLVLHSYEVFALLAALAWWTGWLPLWGYLAGATMHLALDLRFNGDFVAKNFLASYSLAFRAAHGFSVERLFGRVVARPTAPRRFWLAFFRGASMDRTPSGRTP